MSDHNIIDPNIIILFYTISKKSAHSASVSPYSELHFFYSNTVYALSGDQLACGRLECISMVVYRAIGNTIDNIIVVR